MKRLLSESFGENEDLFFHAPYAALFLLLDESGNFEVLAGTQREQVHARRQG